MFIILDTLNESNSDEHLHDNLPGDITKIKSCEDELYCTVASV